MTRRRRLLTISSIVVAFGSLPIPGAQAAARIGTICSPPGDDSAAAFCLDICMPETGECSFSMRQDGRLCCTCDII
jgi:hypothetical protein